MADQDESWRDYYGHRVLNPDPPYWTPETHDQAFAVEQMMAFDQLRPNARKFIRDDEKRY